MQASQQMPENRLHIQCHAHGCAAAHKESNLCDIICQYQTYYHNKFATDGQAASQKLYCRVICNWVGAKACLALFCHNLKSIARAYAHVRAHHDLSVMQGTIRFLRKVLGRAGWRSRCRWTSEVSLSRARGRREDWARGG